MVINYLYLLPLLRLTGQVLAVPMFGCLLSYAHAHYFQPFCVSTLKFFLPPPTPPPFFVGLFIYSIFFFSGQCNAPSIGVLLVYILFIVFVYMFFAPLKLTLYKYIYCLFCQAGWYYVLLYLGFSSQALLHIVQIR